MLQLLTTVKQKANLLTLCLTNVSYCKRFHTANFVLESFIDFFITDENIIIVYNDITAKN